LLNVDIPLNIYDVCEKLGINFYHVSSGCIYSGYDKLWTEEDAPNFGISCPDASWYSKTKHMAERALSTGPNYCLRIRMPFSGVNPPLYTIEERCLLSKLSGYDKLVNTLNSKTYIPEFCNFIFELIKRTIFTYNDKQVIYNYVCSDPLDTKTVVEMMKTEVKFGPWNPEFVEWEDLDIVAKRSNCILSSQKAIDDGFEVFSEMDCMREALGI
jgi:dTDP-4-dehydrorhamnose reductase